MHPTIATSDSLFRLWMYTLSAALLWLLMKFMRHAFKSIFYFMPSVAAWLKKNKLWQRRDFPGESEKKFQL
jgi:hypothetical protein